jgi:hypothetical protein
MITRSIDDVGAVPGSGSCQVSTTRLRGTLSLDQRRIAAALFADEGAQLTGAATLFWYGFKSPLATDRIHILVPHHMRRRSSGFVVVQRTLSLDHAARDVGLFTITSPARAVVDACRLMSDLQGVRAIVAEAVQASFVDIKVARCGDTPGGQKPDGPCTTRPDGSLGRHSVFARGCVTRDHPCAVGSFHPSCGIPI